MSDLERTLAALGATVEERLDQLKRRLQGRAGFFKNIEILPFRGFGTSSEVFMEGRVLQETGLRTPLDNDRVWQNIAATYRRFHTVELPGAIVEAEYQGTKSRFIADEEGYFRVCLTELSGPPKAGWHEIDLALAEPKTEMERSVKGRVLIPPPTAQFGVISDIDDTILVTNATRIVRMLWATFLGNARTRTPFAGAGAFYRGLQHGATGADANPIFYVSSGPWNLYDFITDFMELNSIPPGPLLLQDYGFDREKFFKIGHRKHKIERITQILRMYPNLPFILIGDSGQHDPEIYYEALQASQNRIRAIYIRNVSRNSRGEEVRALSMEAKKHGAELLLVADSYEAAGHAAENGFISHEMLDAVRAEIEANAKLGEEPDLPYEG